jgi:hypothetical protein
VKWNADQKHRNVALIGKRKTAKSQIGWEFEFKNRVGSRVNVTTGNVKKVDAMWNR